MPTDPQRPHGSDTRMNAVVIGGIVCILLAVIHMQTSGFAAAVDPAGLPKVDFLAFWAAGRAANEGALADVYNSAKLLEMEHRIIPVDNFYMPFLNPPPFLALAQILASVTFVTSLQLWMAVCAGVYLAAAWRLFPNRYAFLAAAFFPPFLWSLLIGQMTGLTAVMTVAALLNLEKRPALAGMLIGLLIFKPQGAVLIPVALAASRNWKAFGFAAGTVALLVLLSLGLYGPSLWLDFSGQLREVIAHMYSFRNYDAFYLQSVYGLFLYFDLGQAAGVMAQNVVSLMSVVIVFAAWLKKSVPLTHRVIVLITSTLVFQFYSTIYEYTILYFVIVLLVGRPPYDSGSLRRMLVVVTLAAPLLMLMFFKGPGGFPLSVFLLGVTIYDAFRRRPEPAAPPP